MKRAVVLFLALLFCFALYACGVDDTIPTNQSEPVDSSIDSVPTTNPTGIPTETIVPDGLTKISSRVFYLCLELTSVTIPGTVKEIEQSAFYECSSLTSIHVPFGGLYSGIHSNPMYGAAESTLYCNGEKIVHLEIPESVTYIEEYALAGCETLKSITVHNNVKFDSFVFNDCVGVKDIYFDGTQKEWKDLYLICQGMGSYTIHCSDGDIQK